MSIRILLRFSVFLILIISIIIVSVKFQDIYINSEEKGLTEQKNNQSNKGKKGNKFKESKEYTYRIYEEIPQGIVKKISGLSFLKGGPVTLEDLAYIKLTYWGFDDRTHFGEIIVHKELAQEVAEIFGEIYAAKFPIAKMRLIDEYQADDDLSMADNNTSGLCMRKVRGSDNYSKHSFGIAIDINPVQNPYLCQGILLPQAGKDYVDRQDFREGMIVKGDVVYEAFKNRGWTWGGEWKTLKDYQHFQKNLPVESVE